MSKRRSRFGGRRPKPYAQESRELQLPGELSRAVPQVVAAKQQASIPEPTEALISAAKGRPELSTFITNPTATTDGNQLLYQAESWVKIKLLLETAGPVAVGTREDVAPPLSGKGITINAFEWTIIEIGKGSRLFVSSTSVNRVKFIIEPFAYEDQKLNMLGTLVSLFRGGR